MKKTNLINHQALEEKYNLLIDMIQANIDYILFLKEEIGNIAIYLNIYGQIFTREKITEVTKHINKIELIIKSLKDKKDIFEEKK